MNEAQGNLAALESYASSKETYVSSGNFNDWTIQLVQVDITAPKISKPSQGNDGNGGSNGNGEPILIAANPNANQGGGENNDGQDPFVKFGLIVNEAGEKTGSVISTAMYVAKTKGVSEEALEESFSGVSAVKILGRVTGVISIVDNGSKFFEDPSKNWWNGVKALGQSAAMIAGYATGIEEIELGYNAVTTGVDLGIDYYKYTHGQ